MAAAAVLVVQLQLWLQSRVWGTSVYLQHSALCALHSSMKLLFDFYYFIGSCITRYAPMLPRPASVIQRSSGESNWRCCCTARRCPGTGAWRCEEHPCWEFSLRRQYCGILVLLLGFCASSQMPLVNVGISSQVESFGIAAPQGLEKFVGHDEKIIRSSL